MLQTMKTAGSPPFTPQPRQDIADRQGLARDAARDLAAVAALVLLAALGLAGVAGLGLDYTAKALLVLAAAAWLLWRGLGAHPHARFGPANRVTLVRLGAMALMAALVGEALPARRWAPCPLPRGGWWSQPR